MRIQILAYLFLATAAFAETSPDGVEVVPVYLDESGNGILRYEDPAGGSEEYAAAFGGLSGDAVRPFEVLGALGGAWTGPKVSVCLEGFLPERTMDGRLAFELFSITSAAPVIRFLPVFDAALAEKIVTIGEDVGPGECFR